MFRLTTMASVFRAVLLLLLAVTLQQQAVADVAAPTISSFSPDSAYVGEYGQDITITGTGFTGATSVTFNGGDTLPASFTVVNDTTITAILPQGVITGQLHVITSSGGVWSDDKFIVKPIPTPTITSFTPDSAYVGEYGQTITITGTNFNGAGVNPTGTTSVTFNGQDTLPAVFTVVNDTTITAILPQGVITGVIGVTTSGGNGWSIDKFTVKPIPAPTITSFTPDSAYVGEYGQTITITGTNFNGAGVNPTGTTSVTFNGQDTLPAAFTVVNDTTITAILPQGVTTGQIRVTTSGGNGWSADKFVILQPTTLNVSVNPGSEFVGALTGLGLSYTLIGPNTYTGVLALDNAGKSTISSLWPGSYSMSIFGSHWLSRILTNVVVDGTNSVSTVLANGDADADNSVNLFDFVVLDAKFGSPDPMADLDGDGSVNLFDYVIIDRYFGAQGDPKVGTKVNPIDGAEMVWVPAGEFIMGKDPGYRDTEPQRTIFLDGYWMYKYEVTVAQYRQFCMVTKRNMPTPPFWGWQDTHPIVNVNWQDAADYANWAGVSLPTEAQWEKAARGTDGRMYPWGNEWDATKCASSQAAEPVPTKPVGSYPSGMSPYGCMDMVGNGFQWCSDWYSFSYYQTAPYKNPLGPASGEYRANRGGGNRGSAAGFLCFSRYESPPTAEYSSLGFRCAKAP